MRTGLEMARLRLLSLKSRGAQYLQGAVLRIRRIRRKIRSEIVSEGRGTPTPRGEGVARLSESESQALS
jgi:hypothetical protein